MEKKTKKAKIIDILFIIVVVMCFCVTSLLLYRNICYDKVIVSGKSMEPTLFNGDYGLMKTTSGAKKSIKRFDIVIFKVDETDTSEGHDIIKRIIGMPGETIRINTDGEIFIDNKLLEQSFISDSAKKATYRSGSVAANKDYEIPINAYFALGDNRAASSDSRSRGAISKDSIDGVLKIIYKHCDNDKACKSISARWY